MKIWSSEADRAPRESVRKIQNTQLVGRSTHLLRISYLDCSEARVNFSCGPGQVQKKKMQKAIKNTLESQQGRKCQWWLPTPFLSLCINYDHMALLAEERGGWKSIYFRSFWRVLWESKIFSYAFAQGFILLVGVLMVISSFWIYGGEIVRLEKK